jgi:hypothetical protein
MAFTSFPERFLWYSPKLVTLYEIIAKKSISMALILPYNYAKADAVSAGI